MFEPYRNEPYTDFTAPAAKVAYELALAGIRGQLGASYGAVIFAEELTGGQEFHSVNPCRPDETIGTVHAVSAEQVDDALAAAWSAFPAWAALGAEGRARAMVRLAAVMRRRKYELAAWETLEAAKNWAEAEADVAEAIDFVEYYARQAVTIAQPLSLYGYPGELNDSWLQPIGAGVVIPPWNFPLAILVGMAVGPVAAGNTVVVKPASTTPVIAALFMRDVAEAGIPPGVINLIPGSGAEIGDALVDHPQTRFVNFTGSKEVGLRIAQRAAVAQPGQRWLKRAYLEMGGKDAMVVDETADLDDAAADVVRSAYGFQGQKCSACSRLIVLDEVHDALLDKVADRAAALTVGPAEANSAVAAVISAAQNSAILEEIERGIAEAELITGGDTVDLDGGYYIRPTLFADVDPGGRLAQHEIFGPVLSVIPAADFDTAVEIINGTEFGLTGGLYSNRRDRIERARREFHVGNLYINRKITGALVGVQPFGGFNMSGSNAKAGGPDYLRLFSEMKTVAERL